MLHLTSWEKEKLQVGKVYSTPEGFSNYWNSKLKGGWESISSTEGQHEKLFSAIPQLKEIISPLYGLVNSGKYSSEILKEYVFEEIRLLEFQTKPSRSNCMFCLPAAVSVTDGRKNFNLDENSRPTVLEIEPIADESSVLECDANFLNCNLEKVEGLKSFARRYWAGEQMENTVPLLETLIVGKYKIKEILS